MSEDTKKCPYCAETIKAEAVVCRFCGRDLPTDEQNPIADALPQKTDSKTDKSNATQGCLKGLVLLIVYLILLFIFVVPALGFFGIPISIIAAVLAYLSSNYRDWLRSQPGFIHRLSRLPGAKSTSPTTLVIITLVYLLPLSLLFLFFIRGAFTNIIAALFVGVIGLIGLVVLYGWFIRGWFLPSTKTVTTEEVKDKEQPVTKPASFPLRAASNDIKGNKIAIGLIVFAIVLPVLCLGGSLTYTLVNEPLHEVGLLPTYTPTPSQTPTSTQTPTPSITPTFTPAPTGTPTQTPTQTLTPAPVPTNTPAPPPTDTPSATPTNTPISQEDYIASANADLDYKEINKTDRHIGERVCWKGEVFSIEEENGMTAFQAWYFEGRHPEASDLDAFVVVYDGILPDVYEETEVFACGEVGEKFEGTNAFGATISQPSIYAKFVDLWEPEPLPTPVPINTPTPLPIVDDFGVQKQVGTWGMKLYDVKRAKTVYFFDSGETAQGVWLIPLIEFTNQSGGTRAPSDDLDFYLLDDQGQTFEASINDASLGAAWQFQSGHYYDDIDPGSVLGISLPVDVPENLGNVWLRVEQDPNFAIYLGNVSSIPLEE